MLPYQVSKAYQLPPIQCSFIAICIHIKPSQTHVKSFTRRALIQRYCGNTIHPSAGAVSGWSLLPITGMRTWSDPILSQSWWMYACNFFSRYQISSDDDSELLEYLDVLWGCGTQTGNLKRQGACTSINDYVFKRVFFLPHQQSRVSIQSRLCVCVCVCLSFCK